MSRAAAGLARPSSKWASPSFVSAREWNDRMNDNSFTLQGGPVAVLLVHGLTGTPSEMKTVAKAIARLGYTVHGVQLAGHCGTEAELLQTGWRDWSRSVER